MTATPAAPAAQRQGGSSVIAYRLGGRDYPLRTVAQCRVCSSPHRFEIEKEIAAGRVYQRIIDSLAAADPDIDLKVASLAGHYRNGHMPLETEASRRILERRAQVRGVDVESGVENLVDGMALAETVVQKTYEALQRGEIKPDLKDGLTAARILETFAPVETGADAATYAQVFMVYHEVAQMLMSTSQFEEFGHRLSEHPVLKALIARYEGGAAIEAAQDEQDGDDPATVVRSEAVAPRNIDNDGAND